MFAVAILTEESMDVGFIFARNTPMENTNFALGVAMEESRLTRSQNTPNGLNLEIQTNLGRNGEKSNQLSRRLKKIRIFLATKTPSS